MKIILIILFSFAVWSSLSAQNVGINNTNPQTALDIEGRLRIRPALLTVTGATVTIPNGNTGYHTLSGTPGTDFTVTLPTGNAGSFLLIENTTANVSTLTGLAKILPGKSRLLLRGNTDWILANDTESQLEKITEAGNTGWRLLGSNPGNYGNIGQVAIDLSFSDFPLLSLGATGRNSVAMGIYTRASGIFSTAIGEATIASGDASTAMGYRTIASGGASTATGGETTASESSSTAMGSSTTASGTSSTAMGKQTAASGAFSTAMGDSTTTRAYTSLAIGRYNDIIAGSDPNNWVSTDPLLNIRNGSSLASPSNAMTVYKNGNTDLNGFVSLGSLADNAPRIKVKKITTTLNGSCNGSVAHVLNESKILDLQVKVTNSYGSLVFDGNSIGNNSFNAYIDAGNVLINAVAGNNGDNINRPATITITYEEYLKRAFCYLL